MAKRRKETLDMDTMAVPNPHGLTVPDLRRVRGELAYYEDRVTVGRQLRDDPLGQMHARRQIGAAQYRAGREYQATFEAAGVGRMRSSGDIREHVDGGQIASDGMTDHQLAAAKRLARWRYRLGRRLAAIVDAVLIDKRTLREVSDAGRAMPGKRATRDIGVEFRRALSIIAREARLEGP